MNKEKLKQILKEHAMWLQDNTSGKRADLSYADLRNSDLRNADLYDANLSSADMRYADLSDADLRNADLSDANLDFACWPLWCGSLNVMVDDKIKAQLLYHFLSVAPEFKTKELVEFANTFHRIPEVPKLKETKQ